MKEITRRLYTKPVMLGMAFLVGIALVVFVTSKSTAMQSGFPVPAGNDEFETTADAESYHDFASDPVDANFFGSGSLAFSGLVPLEGVPLNPAVSYVDTIIERAQAVSAPGGSTPITMTGLSLKSINPITVSYSGGGTETWNVYVGLSIFKSSTGTMTINSSTFDSTLKVWPRFTFKRVTGGVEDGTVKVLDTGGDSGGLTASSATSPRGNSAAAEPTATAIAVCRATATNDFQSFQQNKASGANLSAATTAASACPPVTLSSVNSPWNPCPPSGFCIPVPITEEERWARHRPHPKGTKGAVVNGE